MSHAVRNWQTLVYDHGGRGGVRRVCLLVVDGSGSGTSTARENLVYGACSDSNDTALVRTNLLR